MKGYEVGEYQEVAKYLVVCREGPYNKQEREREREREKKTRLFYCEVSGP